MKKLCSLLLTLCFFVLACTGAAFAAGAEEPATEAESSVLADVLGAVDSAYIGTHAKFYVKAAPKAGLYSKVKVSFQGTDLNGTLYLPGNVTSDDLFFCWNEKKMTVSKNGKTLKSGEAAIAPIGKSVTYDVKVGDQVGPVIIRTVQGSAAVEPMFLTLDESKGTVKAMNRDPEHETSCYGKAKFGDINKYISIKGRGNSTWNFPKKPYNITFYEDGRFDDKKKVELVDGVKAKKWSLVANHLDASLLRNKIAMDLAEDLGIGMKTRFVDLWINGTYQGNYLLTPKNDYNTPEGGYALESDNYVEPEDQFSLPGMMEIGDVPGVSILGSGYYNRITIKDVGDTAKENGLSNKTIEKHFLKAWKALEDYDSEEYQNYFDLDSWAKMYLMYEVTKTYDCYAGSLLMHRDGLTKSDKLIAGPAWDYDVSLGRTLHKFFVGVAEPVQVTAEGWFNDSIGLMAVDQPISLLQELGKHASFMKAVSRVWNENKSAFEGITKNVDRQASLLKGSALMNNVRWGTNNLCAEYVIAPNTMSAIGTGKYKLHYQVTTTWDNYVYNLREYADKRVLWLSDHLAPGATVVTEHGGSVKL